MAFAISVMKYRIIGSRYNVENAVFLSFKSQRRLRSMEHFNNIKTICETIK